MNWQTACRVSPGMFACVTSGGKLKYVDHWKRLDRALLRVVKGRLKRLIIVMPPRWGKSELVSKTLPAWYLGENPTHNVILASYETSFAESWGYKARSIFKEYSFDVWEVEIDKEFMSRGWWLTQKGGGMACSGIQAGITGKGAHLFIVDDSVKNAKQARSKLVRDNIFDEYRATTMTRLEPDGAMILMHTRWHEDDLIGRVIAQAKEDGEEWEVIKIPALDENGDSTFPERWPTERLLQIKMTLGNYFWSALYQGEPTPADGGMFKKEWIRYYDTMPEKFDKIIQSWDLTFGDTGSSYVVGLILGRYKADTYLIDMYRGKWDFPMQTKTIKLAYVKYPNAHRILIERKANGQATIDTLKGIVPGIIPINPTESKEARASAVSYLVESGNFLIPSYRQDIKDTIDEDLIPFPNGVVDDFTDALSQGLSDLYVKQHTMSGIISDL